MKKTKLMRKANLVISGMKKGDEHKVYEELFNCLKTNLSLKPIIQYYNFTLDDFFELSRRFRAMGFEWEKGDYIPISVFCFARPLAFILGNIEVFNDGNYEQLINFTYGAIELLN